jgi:hypothetical protein
MPKALYLREFPRPSRRVDKVGFVEFLKGASEAKRARSQPEDAHTW